MLAQCHLPTTGTEGKVRCSKEQMACAQELDEQNIPAEPHQAGATSSFSVLLEIITEPLLHIRDFLSQGHEKEGAGKEIDCLQSIRSKFPTA